MSIGKLFTPSQVFTTLREVKMKPAKLSHTHSPCQHAVVTLNGFSEEITNTMEVFHALLTPIPVDEILQSNLQWIDWLDHVKYLIL